MLVKQEFIVDRFITIAALQSYIFLMLYTKFRGVGESKRIEQTTVNRRSSGKFT